MVSSSCGGRNSSCTCALCLVLERVVNTCYRKGRTPAFIQSAVEKLRELQGELLDLAELEERALLSPGIAGSGAPHPGPGQSISEGGAFAPQSASPPKRPRSEEKEREKPTTRSPRKTSPSPRSHHHHSRKKSHRHKKEREERERSPSYSRKKRQVEESKEELKIPRTHRRHRRPEEVEVRREEELPPAKRLEAASSRRHTKEELVSEDQASGVESEEDKKVSSAPCATAKVKPAPSASEGAELEEGRGRSRSLSVRKRRPVSPEVGPIRKSGWKGPIPAASQRRGYSPPRFGKNRGRKKYQRNEDVRRLGWQNFHATKRRS